MDLFNKLLQYYNITNEQYIQFTKPIKQVELPDFTGNSSLILAKEIIEHSIQNKEKIMVYGDYDVDGLTSTSILVMTLKKLGANYGYYIPSRYQDGYGINVKRVNEIAKKGYDLIITVDNGVSQIEAIQQAKQLGLKVIITDHHEILKALPPADAIIHPQYSLHTLDKISGAFVALLLSKMLLGYYDNYQIALAGIAVLSDAMPLNCITNRELLRLALNNINVYRYKQIISLANKDIIDEEELNYQVIPKLNSPGRVDKTSNINRVVKYLTDKDDGSLLEYLNKSNDLRRKLTNIEVQNSFDSEKFIFYYSNNLSGISGIIASRLANIYNKPILVYTTSDMCDDEYVGSLRSIVNFDIDKYLQNNKDYFLSYGGHSKAGGMTIKKEKLKDLKIVTESQLENISFSIEEKPFLEIAMDDLTIENYLIVQPFGPFGKSFEKPYFKININKNMLDSSKDGKHIITSLNCNTLKFVGFSMWDKLLNIKSSRVNLYGNINLSTFNNKKYIEFRILNIGEN